MVQTSRRRPSYREGGFRGLDLMQSHIELLNDEVFRPEAGRTAGSQSGHSEPDDLMDAYSRAVITAAEKVSPSVVYIEVHQAVRTRGGKASRTQHETRGSGSGVIFTHD